MTRHRIHLFGVWLLLATLLGGGLLAAQALRGPLDDPDMAYQRPGSLDAVDGPFPAPAVTPADPQRGSRSVVFFTRPDLLAEFERTLSGDQNVRREARVVIVVSAPVASTASPPVPVVTDHDRRLAAGYRMRVPRDGGPPVGYAVVDREGMVRYQTLDPEASGRLGEVGTIVAAVP